MKINKWTLGLSAVGLVSLASVAQAAEETAVPLMTALSSTVISGYVDVSAVWNPGTGNEVVPQYSFGQGKQDGFNLNVVGLTLEKPLDEGQWSAGYKADLLFGPDANAYGTTSTGATTSDFAIKQAYVNLRAPVGNGLDFKLGVFDSPMGYESFASYKNPNWTRSYGYTIEPFALTGLLMDYRFCDWLSVSGGMANTMTSAINQRNTYAQVESQKTYIGTVTVTAPESMGFLAGSALYGGIVNGWNGGGSTENQTSLYFGATLNTPITGLKVGAAYDQAQNFAPAVGVAGSDFVNVYAVYASFQATEKLSFHARGEYARLVGMDILEATATIQYDLWENVVSRLEVRWDHSESGGNPWGGTGSVPLDTNLNNYWMVAANFVYKF